MELKDIAGNVLFALETASTVIELVKAAVADKKNLSGVYLRGADLSCADLSGADLRGADRWSTDPPVDGWTQTPDGTLTRTVAS